MTQYDPQARLLLWARALREGKDVYRIRAAEKFSIPENEVTQEQRDEAKRELFRMMYTPPAPERWTFSELDMEGNDVRVVELPDVDYSSLEKRAVVYMAESSAAQACGLYATAAKKLIETTALVKLIDWQEAELARVTQVVRAGAVTVEELAKALGEASAALERADKLQVTYNVPASIPRKRGEAQWKRESRARFTRR